MHNFLVIMGKSNNDQFLFGKILFLPVMAKKKAESKEHCSPTRSKTVFFNILLEKGCKKP